MKTMKFVGLMLVSVLPAMFLAACGPCEQHSVPATSNAGPASQAPMVRKNLIPDSVGVAIVYDNSGSMASSIPDGKGGSASKWDLANQSLAKILANLHSFYRSNPNLWAGIYTFDGNEVRLDNGKSSLPALSNWLKNPSQPKCNTPLGNTMKRACVDLFNCPASRIHLVVLSDGQNNEGQNPITTINQMDEVKSGINYHFVAVDVNVESFSSIVNRCSTFVKADSGVELDNKINGIFTEKVLVEAE